MASLSLPPPRKPAPVPQLASSEKPSKPSAAAAVAIETKTTLANKNNNGAAAAAALPPSYEERCRAAAEVSKLSAEERRRTGKKLFVPRSLQDFGDGGAFPEIHVAQYPRHLGNPHVKRNNSGSGSQSRALVNVQVDKDGEISYDAIVKGGTNKDKLVYSRLDDMRGRTDEEKDVALPTPEEEQADTAKTAAALQALLDNKTALDKPSGQALQAAQNARSLEEQTQFIKYAANPEAPGYNPAAAQRVIQMVPAQVDPMMPPKHKHLKAPAGPAEDPVPVLHAPPTKLSKEEKEAWNIPACISNWKNMRGYTIPLDKRLAADGRGLREHSINPAFATLSESLYVAEHQARQEVRMRATVQKKLALQEKEQREEELRALAQQARLERGGGGGATATAAAVAAATSGSAQQQAVSDHEDDDESSFDESITRRPDDHDDNRKQEETEDQVAARQREKLRMERKREREREMRMERNVELKKKKRMEEERDVSEKIALGVHTGTGGGLGGDVDARLYSQTGGMDSGFGREDEYNAYSKPLFERQAAASSASIYRPTRGETEYNADEQYDKLVKGSTTKFQPDKGFAGAEGGMDMQAGSRTAPVQFEKGQSSSSK